MKYLESGREYFLRSACLLAFLTAVLCPGCSSARAKNPEPRYDAYVQHLQEKLPKGWEISRRENVISISRNMGFRRFPPEPERTGPPKLAGTRRPGIRLPQIVRLDLRIQPYLSPKALEARSRVLGQKRQEGVREFERDFQGVSYSKDFVDSEHDYPWEYYFYPRDREEEARILTYIAKYSTFTKLPECYSKKFGFSCNPESNKDRVRFQGIQLDAEQLRDYETGARIVFATLKRYDGLEWKIDLEYLRRTSGFLRLDLPKVEEAP